jgi:hypothetical protein
LAISSHLGTSQDIDFYLAVAHFLLQLLYLVNIDVFLCSLAIFSSLLVVLFGRGENLFD